MKESNQEIDYKKERKDLLRKVKVASFVLYKTVNALIIDRSPLREMSTFHGIDVIKMEGFMRQRQYSWFEDIFKKYDIKNVVETGFNGGHSAFAFANLGAETITSFDIGEHQYVYPAFDYVKSRFPDTKFNLIIGDSRDTVPEHASTKSIDLVFIDGGHSYDVASADIKNMSRLAPGGLVVVDDYQTWRSGPKLAYDQAIQNGIIQPISVESGDLRSWAFGRFADKAKNQCNNIPSSAA